MKPLTLPWIGADVPHAMLDINRGCDIRCRACYNARPEFRKPLEDIARDLDALMRLRRLHTITIVGGEPLLHPDLDAIIKMIKQRGLRVALATNGLALDDARAARLASSGLDLVLLHVDPGQVRADLPDPMDRSAVRALRMRKFDLLANHGITCGMLSTIFARDQDDIGETLGLLLDVPAVRYVVFTGHADFPHYGGIAGDVDGGFQSTGSAHGASARQVTNAHCKEIMHHQFHARPFAVLPSSGPVAYDAWLSYHAVVAYDHGRAVDRRFLSSSLLERAALRIARACHGRHAFFHEEPPWVQRVQLVLNALSGGNLSTNLRMLLHAARRHSLVSKHIVFQQGPTRDAQGNLSICRDCPDAVVVDGRLLPVCISDRIHREAG